MAPRSSSGVRPRATVATAAASSASGELSDLGAIGHGSGSCTVGWRVAERLSPDARAERARAGAGRIVHPAERDRLTA